MNQECRSYSAVWFCPKVSYEVGVAWADQFPKWLTHMVGFSQAAGVFSDIVTALQVGDSREEGRNCSAFYHLASEVRHHLTQYLLEVTGSSQHLRRGD